ncbi:MAG: outer membrane chaperone Skp [Planctomycetaceae bacterium]|nr:outer membrane chaperone Skp [Planctomycetaceae bacterium]
MLIGIGLMGQSWSQNPAKTTTTKIPHKVGLVDMAKVFKEYDKFSALREDLKKEIQKSDEQAKAMALQIKKIQAEIKGFSQGSPDYAKREAELAKLSAELQAFSKVAQRDFLRKESQIYRTVYMEAVDVIGKYADYYNFTLIMRFNGEKIDTDDPQKLIQGLNRQVVYHRPQDDITVPIIEYLNQRYRKANPSAAKPADRSATGTGTTTKN